MKTEDIKKKILGNEHQQKMKAGMKEGIKKAGERNREALKKLMDQEKETPVATEALAEKFVNFLESIKESDPTLVESLQEAFATCFMESDEAPSFFDEAYFNKEKARVMSDYSDALSEQRMYALVQKLITLPSHEDRLTYIYKIGMSDDPRKFTVSGQFINDILTAYETASKE